MEKVGIYSSLASFVITFGVLPFVPAEMKVAVAAAAIGLWGIGIVGLAPHLRQPSNPPKPVRR